MAAKKFSEPAASEITPEHVYLNRRNFIRAGLMAGTAAATGLTYRYFNPKSIQQTETAQITNVQTPKNVSPVGEPNSFEDITNYNNYYEFSTDKRSVARKAQK